MNWIWRIWIGPLLLWSLNTPKISRHCSGYVLFFIKMYPSKPCTHHPVPLRTCWRFLQLNCCFLGVGWGPWEKRVGGVAVWKKRFAQGRRTPGPSEKQKVIMEAWLTEVMATLAGKQLCRLQTAGHVKPSAALQEVAITTRRSCTEQWEEAKKALKGILIQYKDLFPHVLLNKFVSSSEEMSNVYWCLYC